MSTADDQKGTMMGTNYYAQVNRCDCCGRADEVHIGKSYRMLRAYTDNSLAGTIQSWADWKMWLAENDAVIINEYEEFVDRDSFISQWTPQENVQELVDRLNKDWLTNFGTTNHDFVDPEGFHMVRREFS